MKSIIALNHKEHGKLGWVKPENYSFASKETSIGLTFYELHKAMMTFPIAFLKSNDTFSAIAIVGISNEENLFIDDSGNWLLGYIPVILRTYPIALVSQTGGSSGLGFMQDSDLMSDDKCVASFFTEDGELSNELRQVVDEGKKAHNPVYDEILIGEALQKYKLCEEWPLVANLKDSKVDMTGLWRINQQRLKSLNSEELIELHKLNVLPVIYSQLFSMQNFQLFSKLIDYKNLLKNRKKKAEKPPLDLSFLNSGDSINFDNLD